MLLSIHIQIELLNDFFLFRNNEPDPSPIITKKTKPRPPSNNSKRPKKSKILSSSEDDYTTETDVDDEELTMTLTPPQRGSRAQRPRKILKNPVTDDSEDEFQSQVCCYILIVFS